MILTRGIATNVGGYLPIVTITQGISSAASLLTSGSVGNLDDFFAHFRPMPGGSLIKNQISHYPFPNQSIAANAIIAQPLNISMQMICPARENAGYPLKLLTLTALQSTLAQHNNSGGTYSVMTPGYIYTDCIMTDMRDVSGQDTKQVQYAWQLDFEQPLVSLQAAQNSLNSLLQRFTNGTPPGAPSGAPATGLPVGSPANLAA